MANEDQIVAGQLQDHEESEERQRIVDATDAGVQALMDVMPAEWEKWYRAWNFFVDAAVTGNFDRYVATVNEGTALIRDDLEGAARVTAVLKGLPLVAKHEWGIGESDD